MTMQVAGGVVERVIATSDGAALSVRVEGAGPDLLLVAGLGGTAAFWSPVVPALAGAFRVARFDQRGIGGSTRGAAACTIDELARDCLAVMDALGVGRTVLVGHSTGGAIGQALARIAPERVERLVLSATWLGPSRYMGALFAARRRLLDLDPAAYAAMGALVGHAPAWLEEHWGAFEAALAAAPASEEARRVVRERIDALVAFDGSGSAATIAAPSLVLGVRDDAIVPAFLQEELAAALGPRARLLVHDEGGHFFPATHPERFVHDVAGFARGEA